jgi:hypothetical protein
MSKILSGGNTSVPLISESDSDIDLVSRLHGHVMILRQWKVVADATTDLRERFRQLIFLKDEIERLIQECCRRLGKSRELRNLMVDFRVRYRTVRFDFPHAKVKPFDELYVLEPLDRIICDLSLEPRDEPSNGAGAGQAAMKAGDWHATKTDRLGTAGGTAIMLHPDDVKILRALAAGFCGSARRIR